MTSNVDSRTLFAKQVQGHTQALCDLLACSPGSPVPDELIARCRVSTRMLSGSSSLMGHADWEKLFDRYGSLLDRFKETTSVWDERIAQVISELVEHEESLAAAENAAPAAVTSFDALCSEIDSLMELLPFRASADEGSGEGAPVGEADPAPPVQVVSPPAGNPTNDVQAGSESRAEIDPDRPLSGIVSSLERLAAEVSQDLASQAFTSRDWKCPEVERLRSRLHEIGFLVRSVDRVVDDGVMGAVPLPRSGLEPVETALHDYAREISREGRRGLAIEFFADGVHVDPRMFGAIGAVLQRVVADTFHRTVVETLTIRISARERAGAIHWQVSDNGDNFISDSRLDHEDQLAFYTGLREVRRILKHCNSVLSVEPDEAREVRFAFSTPKDRSPEAFISWGEKESRFCVRSSQICDVTSMTQSPRGADAYGEFLTVDSRRVPLLDLTDLFPMAPSRGNAVAIVGSLEKRLALYVPDAGELCSGIPVYGVPPVWKGAGQRAAEIEEHRVPLIDAAQLLGAYLELTGKMADGGVSGGVLQDASEVSNSQATDDPVVQAPPDHIARGNGAGGGDVLVVEQSESLRETLRHILSENGVSAAFAGSIDEALQLIAARAPRLIISEFRMPSMAARVIVEHLRAGGPETPVLVTTSQSGKTADLLVEKLGVAGYLSKPIDRGDVAARLRVFLGAGSAT